MKASIPMFAQGAPKDTHMGLCTPRAELDIFQDLAELCIRPGFVHALAWMSLRDNYVAFENELDGNALASSYAPGRTVRTEFSTLLGLLIRQPIDTSEPGALEVQALFDRTAELLAELHKRLGQPMWEAVINSAKTRREGPSSSPFTRADVLREPIFYGGDSAYSFQYREMAIDRYAADEAWLLAHKRFAMKDAQFVAKGISDLQSKKIRGALSGLDPNSPSFTALLSAFMFTAEEIASQVDLPADTVRAVLAALSVYAPANADFTSLSAFNLAAACPIIAQPEGAYIALNVYAILESLYDSPFYWMVADKAYRAKASAHRGSFTERFVAKRLRASFGSDNVHCNVNIDGRRDRLSEIDVLVLFGDRAVIVQCKSKKMTLESRKGNDQALRDDFRKAVQDAYDQGLLCAKSLVRSDLEFVNENRTRLSIPDLTEIYIICAVSDHYPVLTVQARSFLNYEQDNIIQAPLVADVFLIDVLTEMLASPLRFLSYINRRTRYAERVHGTNELAILGYHLSQNLWFDDRTNLAMIADECSMQLDTAMTVRREGVPGSATPDGVLTKLNGTIVGRIVEKIEHEADPDLIDLGFLLLDLDGATIDQLEHGLKDVARRTRLDGQRHDFTLVFETGSSGLTVHCSNAPPRDAVEVLADHCRRRKYLHEAGQWFGFVIREADSLPKFSIALRFPWRQDAELDVLTQGMALRDGRGPSKPMSSRRAPDGTKIGRNEPCYCGSGRKFKKCCLV
ncbi:SEC-C metal-binding domain-containing protein [Bradyrhizobium oligotrophicum]|uniref:SEC-C metal-binding domain-containing protein n=1 Tax=Bradyrhizobium oligotrophicum TaxID=44255 RepID=UPI003EC12A1F